MSRIAAKCAARYRKGWTIRAIDLYDGRSYGSARQLLLDAGVTLRPRGSARIRTH